MSVVIAVVKGYGLEGDSTPRYSGSTNPDTYVPSLTPPPRRHTKDQRPKCPLFKVLIFIPVNVSLSMLTEGTAEDSLPLLGTKRLRLFKRAPSLFFFRDETSRS